MVISHTVTDLIEQNSDDLEAYSRQPCPIMSGIKKQNNETIKTIQVEVVQHLKETEIPEDVIMQNIDKLHGTSTYNHEAKRLSVIVKCNSHCFREKIYCQRRKINGVIACPSMSKRKMEALTQTTNYHEKETSGQNSPVNFLFADIMGNLKLFLKQTHKNRSVFSYSSPLEFTQIVESELNYYKNIFMGILCVLMKTSYDQSIKLTISVCLLFCFVRPDLHLWSIS